MSRLVSAPLVRINKQPRVHSARAASELAIKKAVNDRQGRQSAGGSRGATTKPFPASRFLAIIISMAFHLDPGYQAAPYPEERAACQQPGDRMQGQCLAEPLADLLRRERRPILAQAGARMALDYAKALRRGRPSPPSQRTSVNGRIGL